MPAPIIAAAGIAAAGGIAAARMSSKAAKNTAQAGKEAQQGANYLAYTQADIAKEQWDWYKDHVVPGQEALLSEAQNYNTNAKKAEMAGIAAADVAQAFGAQRDAYRRNMMRYGVNPASGKFAGTERNVGISEALAKAGAMTGAARGVDNDAYSRQFSALQLASNQASGVQAGLGSAASTLAGIGASQQNAAARAAQGSGQLLGSLIGLGGNLAAAYMTRPQAIGYTGIGGASPAAGGLYDSAVANGYYTPTKW